MTRFIKIAAMTVLVLPLIAGCKDAPQQEAVCTPGTTQTCICNNGQISSQRCYSDGTGWGKCACGSQSDGGMPTDGGSGLSCMDMIMCAIGCGDDTTCMLGCLQKASPEAKTIVQNLLVCMQEFCWTICTDNGTQACLACANKSCSAQMTACLSN